MTSELKMLALSIVLGLVQVVLASHAASIQRGYLWTASSRDEAAPRLTGIAGRLERALHNFVETFPLFAAAVLTAHVAGVHSWMTEWGTQLYFWARVAYEGARDRLDRSVDALTHASTIRTKACLNTLATAPPNRIIRYARF